MNQLYEYEVEVGLHKPQEVGRSVTYRGWAYGVQDALGQAMYTVAAENPGWDLTRVIRIGPPHDLVAKAALSRQTSEAIMQTVVDAVKKSGVSR